MIKNRCDWVIAQDPLYVKYHDTEWGVPVRDDKVFYEFLLLESFQAGLNWRTILHKRENFRQAFDDFDYHKIANYNENDFQVLLLNKGIVRNKLKILAAINNAQRFMEVQNEFHSFSNYIWSFTQNKVIVGGWKNIGEVPTTTNLSDRVSKDLKKRGFKFLGSTTIYAFLQATGIVNDHIKNCFCYP